MTMTDNPERNSRLHAPRDLKIKKYSNRRFYDTTRSCHVTLGELHDLIRAGHEVTVTDSKSGEDITHLVLTQILLERDAPKLNIFPSNILHEVIRTQQEMLGSVVEQFFRQALDAHRASHERWTSFMRNVLGATPMGAAANAMMPPSPLEWTRAMMEAFTGKPPPPAGASPGAEPLRDQGDELSQLRKQISELTRTVEKLSASKTAGA
jgi:polyhydroxyalkanoate synthesis repressor PhaR